MIPNWIKELREKNNFT